MTQESSKYEIDPLEEYKLIINARNYHYSKFHVWSAYFSVIVGALFVGYYNVTKEGTIKNEEFEPLIAILGYIVSMCWYLSSKGYVYWEIHWIKYLLYVEDKIRSNYTDGSSVYKSFFNTNEKEKKIDDGGYWKVWERANISTSKVILLMTFTVTVAWGYLLTASMQNINWNNMLIYALRISTAIAATLLLSQAARLIKSHMKEHNLIHRQETSKSTDSSNKTNDKMDNKNTSKYIICDYGDAEIGKSTTLRDVISFLELSKNAVRDGEIEWIYDGATKSSTDWYAKYIIDGVKVTVCTQGDPDSVQPTKLIESATWGADVIVCAARDDCGAARNEIVGKKRVLDFVDKTNKKVKGAVDDIEDNITTVDNIYKCGGKKDDDYIIIWHRNFFVSNGDENYHTLDSNTIKEMCRVSAKGIIELIETLKSVTIL